MRATVRSFALTVCAAGTALVTLTGCGGDSSPAAPTTTAISGLTSATSVPQTASITIRGSVVDSAGRQLANINIECLGVSCQRSGVDVIADGHQHRIGQTDASGRFEMIATGDTRSAFLVNANGQGYHVSWKQVDWPAASCTPDQPSCAITLDFQLSSVED